LRCTGGFWRRSPASSVGELSYTLSGPTRYPTVLFLHGFMGSAADWRDVTTVLGDRVRCLAADLPGHGASLGLPPEEYTVDGAARALLDLLDELGIERSIVVGYSMGGRLALYFALRHPERCAGLFLESASPGIEKAAEREAWRYADEEKAKRLASSDFGEFLADWYRQPLFASLARCEGLVERAVEERRRNYPAELARSLRGMGAGNQPSLWGELSRLQAPVLAVAGALDEKYAMIADRMASFNPKIRLAVIPGVGHNIHLESPSAFIALLRRFLWYL
jgi:2-succinyl-6-hydroxy-2,4-cyclohexadiene-1-carboxylate synthase